MVAEQSKFISTQFEGYLLEPNLLYLRYFQGEEVNAETIFKGIELHDELGLDENIKRIVHCEDFVTITQEAREIVQKEGRPAIAEAYVINSLAQKILFNIYNKFRKRKHPLKAFNSLEDALNWLADY